MDYLFEILYKMGFGLILIWFLSFGISRCWNGKPTGDFIISSGSHWKNIDPNRPVTDIVSLDYDTRMVTYRSEGKYQGKYKTQRNSQSNGEALKTGNATINTGLSNEEILEQLDLDYHDVRDYLGDELR